MLLINLIPLAPCYGGLVLGPDLSSNSQHNLSLGSLITSVFSQGQTR